MPFSVGDKLGGYEILASIGAGGMGEVYRANDTKLDREVAIKVLPVTGERKPFPFLSTPFSEQERVFSPDGKWVAYQSGIGTL